MSEIYVNLNQSLIFQINPYFQQQYSDGTSWVNYDYLERMYDDEMLPPEADLESLDNYMHDASRFVPEAAGFFENVNENIPGVHSLQSDIPRNPEVPASRQFFQPSLCQTAKYSGNERWYQETDVSNILSSPNMG